jgi:sterol desaturase/sphingolipid hydroxylase (fatty acid hydroxylase superfamily)
MDGIGFKVLLLGLEWVNPRLKAGAHLEGTGHRPVLCGPWLHADPHDEQPDGQRRDGDSGATCDALGKVHLVHRLPLLVQAFLIAFIFDFGQYWMHRGMHNWYPLWLPHSVHHYITQLNINKGAVGNPVELFLIGLGAGGFFDFLPRAALMAGSFGLAVGIYQHINVRFNSPRWWRFLFNTTEHHSLHHSQDFEATRSNYAGSFIFIDRMFGTCVDGEAELLGLEGGRRMSIREQMTYPFTEGWKTTKAKFRRAELPTSTAPAE